MSTQFQKVYLNKSNERNFRDIYRSSFPGSNWRDNVPFPKDPVYVIYHAETGDNPHDGQYSNFLKNSMSKEPTVVGFCMVHESTPYPMEYGPAPYMYNLCIHPEYRKKGCARSLLKWLLSLEEYAQTGLYCHMQADSPALGWITRYGWNKLANSKFNLVEFFHPPQGIQLHETVEKKDWPLSSKNYDAAENVIYLS
jgi:ribosomal protein S18 acetylase RimI-like enzyme